MRYNLILKITAKLVLIGAFLVGCDSDGSSEFELTVESTYVSNLVELEAISLNTIMLVDEFMRDTTLQSNGSTTLYNDIIGEFTANELTITFGKAGAGTTNPDGILRSGKINATFHLGPYQASGTEVTIDFNSFRMKNKPMSGQLRLTNNGLLPNGHEFDVQLDSLTLDSNMLSYNRYLRHLTAFTPLLPLERSVSISTLSAANYYDQQNQMRSLLSLQTPITWDESCTYKVTGGLMDVLPDSTLAGTDKIVIDYIEDSDCANLVRGYSEEKDQYFFLPKRGF